MNNRNDEIEIDLMELVQVLLARLWVIALAALVTGVMGFILSAYVIAPKYESSTSMYIMTKQNGATTTYTDVQMSTQLTKDYEKLVKGRYVIEKVINDSGLGTKYEDFKDKVTVTNETGTHIIEVRVKDEDPYLARKLADAIREVASEHIQSVTDVQAVNVTEYANLPENPVEPSVMKWTLIGLMIGFIISAGIIIFIHLMDDTIKTKEDVEKYLGLSTLALIPDSTVETKSSKKGRRS